MSVLHVLLGLFPAKRVCDYMSESSFEDEGATFSNMRGARSMSPLLAQSFAGELDIYVRSKVILSYTLRGETNTLIWIVRWFARQLVITSYDSGASLA